jgi:hypothetical protein
MFTFRTHKDLQFSDVLRLKLLYLLKEYWANLIGEEQLCDRMFQAIREDRFPQYSQVDASKSLLEGRT